MKLKINKACDLSSISVLPPQTRRSSAAAIGPQASQIQLQPSQQSFSQGLSSQHGMFSQLSQSSLDEIMTNDQRAISQERQNNEKKFSCLPSASFIREESQMPMSRSSTGLVRKLNPASALDHRCQVSEELERRIGKMETSLNRLGMTLDSVQSDIIQVNKGSKELMLEVEGLCQKLVVQDSTLQLMKKGLEDIKVTLDGGLKSSSNQMGKDMSEDKFKEIFLELSSLPGMINTSLLKLHHEVCSFLRKEMKVVASSLKSPNPEGQVAIVLPQKRAGHRATSLRKPELSKNQAVPPKVNQETQFTKQEMGGWKSVKKPQATSKERISSIEHKRKTVSSIVREKECRIIIDSDEEIDRGFSCLIDEKDTDNKKMIEDVKAETERILRKARRQKRKYDNPVIIN